MSPYDFVSIFNFGMCFGQIREYLSFSFGLAKCFTQTFIHYLLFNKNIDIFGKTIIIIFESAMMEYLINKLCNSDL